MEWKVAFYNHFIFKTIYTPQCNQKPKEMEVQRINQITLVDLKKKRKTKNGSEIDARKRNECLTDTMRYTQKTKEQTDKW